MFKLQGLVGNAEALEILPNHNDIPIDLGCGVSIFIKVPLPVIPDPAEYKRYLKLHYQKIGKPKFLVYMHKNHKEPGPTYHQKIYKNVKRINLNDVAEHLDQVSESGYAYFNMVSDTDMTINVKYDMTRITLTDE